MHTSRSNSPLFIFTVVVMIAMAIVIFGSAPNVQAQNINTPTPEVQAQDVVTPTSEVDAQIVEGTSAAPIMIRGNGAALQQTSAIFSFVYNTAVADMIGGVQQSDVYNYAGNLSGKSSIIVGGSSFTLTTRNMYSAQSISKATQYVYEFMQIQGLSVSYQDWYDSGENMSGRNVIGALTGTLRPTEIVLITAHLDDMPEGSVAPGADDNASGSVGVMMAAARLAGHQFERTVRFVFFTGEEQGTLGSYAYAAAAKARGENIVAVYNMDMIGWDANNDGVMALETRNTNNAGYASDLAIANVFTQVVNTYGISELHPVVDPCNDQEVDSAMFWDKGYPSITAIEDWDEGNPYYHTKNDTLQNLNLSFFTSFVKASVGTLAHLAIPVSAPASVTISGNAGVEGATLSYTDGTAKTATADSNGNYSISVPYGWSGTITPIRTGFPFTPVSRSYSNVQSNQTAQDYINYWYGSVSITSNKNVVAVGRPHVGDEVASYSGFSAGALTAYIPMLFKNAYDGGTYDSALYVQNVDSSVTANVTIKYYNSLTGALTCSDTDTIKPLASKGYWLPTLSATECLPAGLPVGWVGSAVVTSTTAKIVAIGRPHIGGEVMTYDSFSSGSLTSYLPMLFNGAYGGDYNSAFYVQNVSPSATAEVTIKYYDSAAGALTCTDTDTILPNTSKGYWLPTLSATECLPAGLPAGWVGGVVVTSSAAPIVSVGRPHIGTQITTYNGFAAGGLSSYVPMLFRKAYGGTYDSALYVQNVDLSATANVTIKYYKTDGTLTCTDTDTIAPLSSKGYWLPTLSATECTGGGLPDDWVGGVVVTSSSAKIVAIGRAHIGAQVTTYNGFASGNSNSYLPMLFKNMWGTYDSAFYVQNTDAAGPVSVTVKFYDVDGNLSCIRHDNIPALSTLGYWVPSVTCE